MNGTVHFNTAETVWWFGLFPILTAFTIAFLLLVGRAVLRRVDARFQRRIDTALAYPLTFDEPDPEDDWMLIADVCQKVRNGWAA